MTPAATRSSYSFSLGVVAVVQLVRILDLAHHDGRFRSGVLGDDPDRFLERAADDLHAGLLIVIAALTFSRDF